MTDCITNKKKCDINIARSRPAELKTNWYIFYTCPRAEKVVCEELQKRGYEVFLPITKILRLWKNRQKKLIDKVLFPSYIFVKTVESELDIIKRVNKVATYIHCGGKPSIMSVKEIECIKKMISLNQELSVENSFAEGECVRIVQGPLEGQIGILLKQNGKTRFGIQLIEINQTVFINVSADTLEKIYLS